MSKPKPFHSICVVLLALCLGYGAIPVMAQSQASTGQIQGIVTDAQGAAIAKATVTATNKQTGLARSSTSNDDGLYAILLLPPGPYDVSAEASGFTSTIIRDLEVTVGRTMDVKIQMGVSGVQEVVTVTAGAIQVQTTRSEADAVVNERAIENLPINGRRFQDFVTLTPTAQVEPQRNQISLAGQRGIYGANVNVDGMDYNQPFFGGIRGGERSNNAYTLPQESIKEFQVVATGYSAEFGRSTGGVVNVVTKSGTNQFHGSGLFLARPKSFAMGNKFFDSLQSSLGRKVQPAPDQLQWGASAGGPIKKDKIFFFGAYEQQRYRNPREVLFPRLSTFTPTVKTQEAIDFLSPLQEPFTQTNDAIALLGRVDWELSTNHRFNVRYNYSKNEGKNAVATGDALDPTTIRALSSNGIEKDDTSTVVGQFTSFLAPTLVNELRAQYSHENRPRLTNSETTGVDTVVGSFGTRSFFPTTQSDWRFQLAENLTWTRGSHTIKVGMEYNHVFADQIFGFNQFGVFNISGSDTSLTLDILSLAGCPAGTAGCVANRFDDRSVTYARQLGNLMLAFSSNEMAVFGQDSWRVRPNLTINFGLRWEGQYNPSAQLGNDVLINKIKGFPFPSGHVVDPTQIPDDTKEFGPRVGFAWDPFSDTKTVIRGFGGVYYARTPLLLLTSPANNFRLPPGDLSLTLPLGASTLANNTVYKQLKLIGIDLNTFPLGQLPIVTIQQVQSIAAALGLPSPDPFVGAAPVLMAADFRNPKSTQAGVGIERELARGLTLGADFTYVNTVRLQRNRDVNLPLPKIRPTDPAKRPFYGLVTANTAFSQQRPIPSLGSIQVRESTAHALYRALTIRTKFQRRWGQLNAFYTLAKSLADDDNERNSTGIDYENALDLHSEYGRSRLDRRHQFVANPVFFFPGEFEVASAIRLLSGRALDANMGIDANEDRNNFVSGPNASATDRPFLGPGVPFQRNAFNNRPLYNVDLRLQKRIKIGEAHRLIFSLEFFNLFNITNIELGGTTVQNYCQAPVPLDCGFGAPTNPNFLQIIDKDPNSTRKGQYITSNSIGAPFQMQLGARYQF